MLDDLHQHAQGMVNTFSIKLQPSRRHCIAFPSLSVAHNSASHSAAGSALLSKYAGCSRFIGERSKHTIPVECFKVVGLFSTSLHRRLDTAGCPAAAQLRYFLLAGMSLLRSFSMHYRISAVVLHHLPAHIYVSCLMCATGL